MFTLGTRLTRITRALGLRQGDQALANGRGLVADWDGGTRIGALQAFLAVPRFAALPAARGAHVLSTGSSAASPDRWSTPSAGCAPRLAARLASPLAGDPEFRPQPPASPAAALPRPPGDGSSLGAIARHILDQPPMTGIIDAHHHIWRQADLPWLAAR